MILVTGATGNVGHNLVRELIKTGQQVRALTRDPTSSALPDSIDLVSGDLTRPDTLHAVLQGVDRAFLFPVFGAINGFLANAKQAGTQHIVLLSSAAVTFPQPGRIGEQHLACEQAVADSGISWTFIRPSVFMTNDLAWADQIKHDGTVQGAYGRAATAPGDERDIAAVAAHTLLNPQPAQAHELTGPQALSQIDRGRIIGETLGLPAHFEEMPRDDVRRQLLDHMPPPAADFLLDQLALAQTQPPPCCRPSSGSPDTPPAPTPNGSSIMPRTSKPSQEGTRDPDRPSGGVVLGGLVGVLVQELRFGFGQPGPPQRADSPRHPSRRHDQAPCGQVQCGRQIQAATRVARPACPTHRADCRTRWFNRNCRKAFSLRIIAGLRGLFAQSLDRQEVPSAALETYQLASCHGSASAGGFREYTNRCGASDGLSAMRAHSSWSDLAQLGRLLARGRGGAPSAAASGCPCRCASPTIGHRSAGSTPRQRSPLRGCGPGCPCRQRPRPRSTTRSSRPRCGLHLRADPVWRAARGDGRHGERRRCRPDPATSSRHRAQP